MSDEPDDTPEHGDTYALVTPFLDDDPRYAYGCEFGMIVERLKHTDEYADYVMTANQEQLTLHANRDGWVIDRMEPWPKGEAEPQWFWVEMHRPTIFTEPTP